MFVRKKNTAADEEAKNYEVNGKISKEAWDLVVERFLERTKNMRAEEREILREQYFEGIGQMV